MEDLLIQIIDKIVRKRMVKAVLTGTATEVTDTSCTVSRDDAPDLLGVRLNALDDDLQSFATIVPKASSEVLVAIIEGQEAEAVVIRCSEVEKIIWQCGDMKLSFSADGVVWNDGGNGGIPILQKIQDNLDSLKDFVMALHAALPAAFGAVGAGSAAAGSAGAANYNGAMAGKAISFVDMENPDVKH